MLKSVEILNEIVRKLRSDQGCAWDRQQTHKSLKSGLIEECCEVIDAIDSEDTQALREELGDLLLHIVLHSQIASESGKFDFEQVCAGIVYKMISRHPHIFRPFPKFDGDVEMSHFQTNIEIEAQWEIIKRKEKSERQSAFDGIPPTLSSLARAQKIQNKASQLDLDWPDPSGPRKKIDEELAEATQAIGTDSLDDELGDVLFAVVNWCRKLGVDAESALMKANKKFENRLRLYEKITRDGNFVQGMRAEEIWEIIKDDEEKMAD